MRFEKGNVPWNKGLKGCYSEELRRKMSDARRGKNNPNYGKHLTDEIRKKISEALKGIHRSDETRMKISEAHKGQVPWNKGLTGCYSKETRIRLSNALKGRHLTDEAKRKMSESRRGKHHTDETRRKISEANKGKHIATSEARMKMSKLYKGKHLTDEHKKRISEALKGHIGWSKGRHQTEEAKRKISEALKGNVWVKGQHLPEETKRKLSEAHIRAFKRGCYSVKPTAPEVKFAQICLRHNLPYKYVGDGKFWVEGVNPDFVESNGRKIAVEIYGDYWHKLPNQINKDEKRIAILNKYGWKLFVLWEHELKELPEDEIVRRVM
jgi:G:T-mismatch repair DNA endonuclease (very short patch repair protein)